MRREPFDQRVRLARRRGVREIESGSKAFQMNDVALIALSFQV